MAQVRLYTITLPTMAIMLHGVLFQSAHSLLSRKDVHICASHIAFSMSFETLARLENAVTAETRRAEFSRAYHAGLIVRKQDKLGFPMSCNTPADYALPPLFRSKKLF